MSRLVVYLVAASVLIAWASAACNTLEATELDSGDCNCTDPSLVYDYRENVCKDESDLYCSVRLDPNGNSACPSGFTKNSTTGECVDDDECAMGTGKCETWQMCYNTYGHFHCGCKDGYYSINGKCKNLNESTNPHWNDCPQESYDVTQGYKCRCFNNTMFNDTMSDGRSCELNPGYTNCTKDTDTGVMCVQVSATGEQFFFPKAGYKLNANNEAEDIDECSDSQNIQCWDNSECKNLGNGGGYECTCPLGYTDTLFNGTIKECLPKKCTRAEVLSCVGEALDCVDPCDNVDCLQDEICVLQNNLPTCTRKFIESIFNEPLTEDLFANSIVIWNPDESISQITKSLETVFGAGYVQLLPQNSGFQELSLNVLGSMTQTDAKKRLDTYCVSLSQLPGYCELPGGIIIKNVTTDFTLPIDVCAGNPCPTDTHVCDATTRTCICKDGRTDTYFNDKLQLCNVANDLRKQLIDAEDALKITGAVLGTLLGLSLVAIVVLVFFKKGKFCSS